MGKLKIVDESGAIVYEFNDTGYFGVIDNAFLIEMAAGDLDKNELRAAAHLMSSAKWTNEVDTDVGKGAKTIGVTYNTYSAIIERLKEKKILIEDDEKLYFNPEKFRRRTIKKKKAFIPWHQFKGAWPGQEPQEPLSDAD